MGCGAGKVKIVTPTLGFHTCELNRSGCIYPSWSQPPVPGEVTFKLNRGNGDSLACMVLTCSKTDDKRAFSFDCCMLAGDTTFDLQVAGQKRSQGDYPDWKFCDRNPDAKKPLRVSGSFGQTCFTRVSSWDDESEVLASAMYIMDSMGDYVRDVFVFRGNVSNKGEAEAKSQEKDGLLAFAKDRKNDDLPYLKPIVQKGSGSVHVADEILEYLNGTEEYSKLTCAVFMLLGITMAGLDAGRRYYTTMGAGSSGDGTGPTTGDQSWGALIH